MTRFTLLSLFVVLAFALSACGTAAPAATAPSSDT